MNYLKLLSEAALLFLFAASKSAEIVVKVVLSIALIAFSIRGLNGEFLHEPS